MPWEFFGLFKDLRWDDFLDIALTALLLWAGMQALRTARARAAGIGLLLLGGVFLFSRQLQLELTTWLLQGIAALFVLIVVIVFQDEIRSLIERVPTLLHRPPREEAVSHLAAGVVAETVVQMADEKTGALLVLPGHIPLGGLITEGIPLGGVLSKPLLLSLFDPSSPGHDGAVVLKGQKVERFAVHLPLSTDADQLRDRGTRHAAALGLAERSDATILVVSEETGRVSVARNGMITRLASPEEAAGVIGEYFETYMAAAIGRLGPVAAFFRRGVLEIVLALIISIVLWLVLVPGAVVEEQSFRVPVTVQNIPDGFVLVEVVPVEIDVTLSGARRDLFLFDKKRLGIRIDATLARFGRQTFAITPGHLLVPPEIAVANLVPTQVQVVVKKADK